MLHDFSCSSLCRFEGDFKILLATDICVLGHINMDNASKLKLFFSILLFELELGPEHQTRETDWQLCTINESNNIHTLVQ